MKNKKLTDTQKHLIKNIFNMVYQWGRVGIVVDHNSPAYKTSIGQLLGHPLNGMHKDGSARMKCYIVGCKRKHLLF